MSTASYIGYEAAIVVGFIDAHTEPEKAALFHRGRPPAGELLNGVRLASGDRAMIRRWRTRETVSLGKVDALLFRYGLMTFELEQWAEEHFGRTGYLAE